MERDPTELRRVELAYGAGESAVLRFTLHCGHPVASSNSQLFSLPMTESARPAAMSRERRRPSNRSIPGGIALDQAQLGPKVTIAPWAVGPSEFKADSHLRLIPTYA